MLLRGEGMEKGHGIRSFQSRSAEARQAARELHAGIRQDDMALVIFFCSSHYDLDAFADEINRCFGDTPVIGTTTAGEIGPLAYCNRSVSGASFASADFSIVTGLISQVRKFDPIRGQVIIQSLLQQLEAAAPEASAANSFAFLMIDGLSGKEESVTHICQSELGKLPLVGGSSGDNLELRRTHVFFEGVFYDSSAVLALISTPLPFRTFMTQHFVRGMERMVVTAADPRRRLVIEINGRPAATEYARAIGVPASELGPCHFARSPVVVLIEGRDYVRSIQKCHPDGSLSFFCAIDTGMVLRIAKGYGLIDNLKATFADLQQTTGPLQAVLVCDCTLRNTEVKEKNLNVEVSDIFRDNRALGFNSYGEQFGGVHINQTLTGIAIGSRKDGHDQGR